MSESFWKRIQEEASALIGDEENWVSNLSNLSSLIYHELRDPTNKEFSPRPINWVGFYFVDPKNSSELILGPFQGRVACLRIPLGKGVCGVAAKSQETQLVPDVHLFPGHISCDPVSKSEIVLPVINKNKILVGVLDIDSSILSGLDETDQAGLERVVEILVNSKTKFLV